MGSSGNPAKRAQEQAEAQERELAAAELAFDLDVFESERPVKAPFVVGVAGQRYRLRDAETVDYRDLITAYQRAEIGDLRPFIRLLVADEQRESFDDHDFPMDGLKELMTRYRKHFGITTPGEARASRTY